MKRDTRTIHLGLLAIAPDRPKVNVQVHIDMERITQLVQKAARNAQGTTSFGSGAITLIILPTMNRLEIQL